MWRCFYAIKVYDSALHKLLSDQISFYAFYADVLEAEAEEEGSFMNKTDVSCYCNIPINILWIDNIHYNMCWKKKFVIGNIHFIEKTSWLSNSPFYETVFSPRTNAWVFW